MSEKGITLTIKERMILANQYLMLEVLYPDEAESFKQSRMIVERGYELHYSDLYVAIFDSVLTEEACREVMDILDMFWALNCSYSRLDEKEGIAEEHLRFDGFDGNDGSGRLGYARFLILAQGRWQEVLEERPGFDLNSHHPVIDMYGRMLRVWRRMDRKHNLTGDEIKSILNARVHPESCQ